jgi:ribonucleoside-diphosphate reductase alpha chain
MSVSVTHQDTRHGVEVERRLTDAAKHPFDAVEWEIRDAVIGDPAAPAFEQRGVEFPVSWSQNATNIVAQKYFRGRLSSPERERSVKQMIGRVAGTIAEWGRQGGYFASGESAQAFEDELTHILLHQQAAFNSPVWFNVGFEESPQCSACFLLSVEDDMQSILDWNTKEGLIFRGGSGSGINLSKIRSSKEQLSKGGYASGPVSFMRGADSWAGTIKCLSEGTEVMTERGVRAVEDVTTADRMLTRFGPKSILATHSNGVKPLVRVTTELGNEIVCTAEHRFLVRDASGETDWRQAGAIGDGDHLVLDLSQVEFGQLQRLEPVPGGHHNERDHVLPQVMHRGFARWLGLIYGDGNVTDRPYARYVGLQVDDKDADLAIYYRDLVADVFGPAARIFENARRDKADASKSLRFASTKLVRFLQANGLAKQGDELRIPAQVKSSPSDVRAAFLSGLFEADGSVVSGYPTLSTVSHGLALDVHRLLLSLGIPSKVRRVADRTGAFGTRPLHTVRVVSLAGIARFHQFVGFISVRKWRTLEGAVARKMRSRHETDWALPAAESELTPLWQDADQRLRRALAPYCRYEKPRALSGLRAAALLNAFPELYGTVVEEAASTDVYHTKASVEPAGAGPVFDLTVEDAHEYLVHNTVTHNSGGKTRRAAKMVVLDVDHPDIEDFIWCKAKEEQKALALRDAGFDMSIDGDGFTSIQYQNANNSVRLSDEFMERAERGEDWELTARTDGSVIDTVNASNLLHQIADAAWRCADPGVQYDTTIQEWHTCPNSGRISTSNPCSEYLHVDDSACNLASINLMKFRREDGSFDTEAFQHVVDVVFLAQEIVISPSSYPTELIGKNARAFRQIGLGYANLGALLMANGLPYDSDEGRAMAGAITALMTGRAYRQSAQIARDATGPYDAYELNRDPHNHVMRKHRDAAHTLNDELVEDELLAAARRAWNEAVELGEAHGYRNAQATVLAPTGTISFLMDCDTTGIEPDFSLIKFKELVGGGSMTIVNQTVPQALATLGYEGHEIAQIEAYLAENATLEGAPGLKEEHLPVFDVAVGKRAISHMGHISMMGAVQPVISGAISKTVNMPAQTTVEDIADAYTQAWKLGVKALAIYRDGSKTAQALRTDAQETAAEPEPVAAPEPRPYRKRMPRERMSITHKFSIAGHEGYITAGMYEDGSVGEIFLTDIGKEGSTLRGMMNAFATSISLALQYGVPLETLVRKFSYMRFDPEGITGNPEVPFAKSMPDYIMRWLASRFLDVDIQEELGILTPEVRNRKMAEEALMRADTAAPVGGNGGENGSGNGRGGDSGGSAEPQAGPTPESVKVEKTDGTAEVKPASAAFTEEPPVTPAKLQGLDLGPACGQCGGMMQRTGSCYTCSSCGNNTGCG